MSKLRKLCIFVLSVMTLALSFTACELSTDEISSSDVSSESISDSSESNNESSSNNEDSNESSEENSSEDEYSPEYLYAESIMNEAYLLANGSSLSGTYELSGVVNYIDIDYTSSKGICLYFLVDEPQHREMYCYQLKGTGANLIEVGDHITVSGTIKNYKGLIEFDKGCTLVNY